MILICPACGSKSSIDDRKVPKKAFQAKCAKCAHVFRADGAAAAAPASATYDEDEPRSPAAEEALPATAAPAPLPSTAAGPGQEEIAALVRAEIGRLLPMLLQGRGAPAPSPGGGLLPPVADAFDDDVKRALICEPDEKGFIALSAAAQKLGYGVERIRKVEDSYERLDEGWSVVLVAHSFPEDAEGGKAILRRLAGLTPEQRRDMTVVFVSSKYKSMDGLPAFVLAADFVIASSDLSRATELLREGIRGKEKLYRAFRKSLAKLVV